MAIGAGSTSVPLKGGVGPTPAEQKSPIASKASGPKIMGFEPSKGLAAGLKRVGGRGGISRLGRTQRDTLNKARKGRPITLHNY